MDNEREKIVKQTNETPLEDIVNRKAKVSKKGILKEIVKELFLGPIRLIGGFLGVTEDNISTSNSSARGGHSGGHTHSHSNSGGSTFRESVHFDPSKAYMERIQEKAYFSMIDGKGDHDCDHEH